MAGYEHFISMKELSVWLIENLIKRQIILISCKNVAMQYFHMLENFDILEASTDQ